MDVPHFLFLALLAYSAGGALFVLRFSEVLGMLSERVADEALLAQHRDCFYDSDPAIYLMRKSRGYLAVFVVASWLFYPIVSMITHVIARRLLRYAEQSGTRATARIS